MCLVLLPQNLQSHPAGTLIPNGTQGVEKLPGGLGFRVSAWYGIATLCILVCLADRATYSQEGERYLLPRRVSFKETAP